MYSGDIMANTTKSRPTGVPEENVYNGVHWSIYIGYGVAVLALALLLFGGNS